jgi:hypothetical protein
MFIVDIDSGSCILLDKKFNESMAFGNYVNVYRNKYVTNLFLKNKITYLRKYSLL